VKIPALGRGFPHRHIGVHGEQDQGAGREESRIRVGGSGRTPPRAVRCWMVVRKGASRSAK
jgi:hypothetical protein